MTPSSEQVVEPWVEHAIVWHVYPLGFVGAPIRPEAPQVHVEHRLPRLVGWLDHAVSLGASVLALGPVFASSTHGYDTVDHLRIDPRLGDDADFDALVVAAHDRGLSLVLDGVFNHVGREHPAFQALLAQGPDAPQATWFGGDPAHVGVFEGHDALVELDHGSDAVVDLVVEVMVHWLDRGADGWRLDAAYAVPPAFWARVLPRVREAHPGVLVFGEVIHGDYAAIVAESGLDSVTQYELWQGIWHGIAEGNFFELAHALGRHQELLETFVPMTFLGNHDTTRIATAVGDRRHLPHAVALLATLAGTPSVYAGDELGLEAVKQDRLGGDDAVRPEMPASPDDLDGSGAEVLELYRSLLGFRRRHPWLRTARADVLHLENGSLVLRIGRDDEAVVVALSLLDEPVDLPVADAARVEVGAGALADGSLRLPPHGWAVCTA
ncbi:alpha-amylase family glycosyl hydrolase [Solicola sp. PLA-1-18]|uniref:alpha-amylase family glycosyl hydrolase n=1 Tax=Solicola sp. PLA-1-18 TaxID=3380532 RepID=UPI003B822222